MKRISLLAVFMFLAGAAQAETRVIMLGTGTPLLSAERAGSGFAVIHDGEAYLFDVGHGTVQRAIQAFKTMDAPELYPPLIENVFLSHLHSDHTMGYSELASTLWWRREARLNAYGPKGLQNMTDGYYKMQKIDIALRTDGIQPIDNATMYKVAVHEISKDGIIFNKNNVSVEAFSIDHYILRPLMDIK